jgi:hypothetical protein
VVYSVRVQSRQTLEQRVEAVATQQRELIFKLLERPELASVHGLADESESDRSQATRNSYRNLWFIYLSNAYRVGEVSEASIRRAMRDEFFSSGEGASFWGEARERTRPLPSFKQVSSSTKYSTKSRQQRVRASRRQSPETRDRRPTSRRILRYRDKGVIAALE